MNKVETGTENVAASRMISRRFEAFEKIPDPSRQMTVQNTKTPNATSTTVSNIIPKCQDDRSKSTHLSHKDIAKPTIKLKC